MDTKVWIAAGLLLAALALVAAGCTRPGPDASLPGADRNAPRPDGMDPTPASAGYVYDDAFIVTNPVDLSTIRAVSRFRSCAGHEYAMTNVRGEIEAKSSMKHYFLVRDPDRLDDVPIYAPFDGTVVRIDPMDTWAGRQFIVEHVPFNGWSVTFVHVNLAQGIAEGARVRAGTLLGTAAHKAFDISLQRFDKPTIRAYQQGDQYICYRNLESPFLHMAEPVAREYQNRGLTPETMIVPKSERDTNPCECRSRSESFLCNFDTPMGEPPDWVIVQ
ncbi:MAG: M23 family metallopeptidase [Methanobacteriota archaeon]|nr:MAG: M23 family metallopeptidase [Euryarchaeota archaeon]